MAPLLCGGVAVLAHPVTHPNTSDLTATAIAIFSGHTDPEPMQETRSIKDRA
ncbi:hypothetical protein ABHI18_001593 [Aspergillus niger]